MKKIVFFGTPEFAVPALNALHDAGFDITAVVTAPDKPVGRKAVLTPSVVKVWAIEHGIPVLQPASLKDGSMFEQFLSLSPDVCVVAAYGKIIPQQYLDVPPQGFVNIHPSLLPQYRGASPIKAAILDGKTETGVTIMQIDADMDHGPILAQQTYTIAPDAYFTEVEQELSKMGAKLLVQTLQSPLEPKEQEHDKATSTKKFTREDGRINWSRPAVEIYNQIRALSTEPGTWTTYEGKTLNILKAHIEDGKLVLDEVQLEGGKPMRMEAFRNGHPNFSLAELQ